MTVMEVLIDKHGADVEEALAILRWETGGGLRGGGEGQVRL